ncbi:MAG: hypothetical protein AMS18_16005 [Gemmatimonas sp. SG8_17]|nr:MAG: hypothetical protein AMS18_16005 [Gemmatimonas sp. SG8_17]
MNKTIVVRVLQPMAILQLFVVTAGTAQISLQSLTPENYRYEEATRCVNCKSMGDDIDIKYRVVGVDVSSGSLVLDERGWLGSIHSRSQSHGDRVSTACAWCHAPTANGATRESDAAVPIEKGTWQGVTCGACHPTAVPQGQRHSQLANFVPGSDPVDPASYVFRDRTDPNGFNSQCRYCHHESHDLLVPAKQAMLDSGVIRCGDCHMAGYGTKGELVERFHNMKVAANIPHSCSGAFGTDLSCHADESPEWMRSKLDAIKGPRKEW